MEFKEDPRIKSARKIFFIAWLFFTCYLTTMLLCSYLLGIEPYLFGLPRWVAVGNIIVPIIFVVLLIFVAEKLIPDVSLTDSDAVEEGKK